MAATSVGQHSKPRGRRWAAFVVIAALFAAAGIAWQASKRTALERLYGGPANLAIVARPTKVEAYRLGPLPLEELSHDAAVGAHPVLAGPVELPEADAVAVAAALSSADSYAWHFGKACMPRYGVRLSFVRGPDRVDVLLCFECDILAAWRNGQWLGYEDFDDARPVLVRAVRAAFPDDAEIQSLGESR
jgi:hypothetical protein